MAVAGEPMTAIVIRCWRLSLCSYFLLRRIPFADAGRVVVACFTDIISSPAAAHLSAANFAADTAGIIARYIVDVGVGRRSSACAAGTGVVAGVSRGRAVGTSIGCSIRRIAGPNFDVSVGMSAVDGFVESAVFTVGNFPINISFVGGCYKAFSAAGVCVFNFRCNNAYVCEFSFFVEDDDYIAGASIFGGNFSCGVVVASTENAVTN